MRHIIDPTYYDDILLDCGDWITLYSREEVQVDEYGEIRYTWKPYQIWGSLQPETRTKQDVSSGGMGRNVELNYNLYCGSEYKVHIDDLIELEDGNFLTIIEYTPWDGFGVREAKCKGINLSETVDLKEFKDYYEGIKTK